MDEHAYFEEMREQLRKLTAIMLPIDFPTWTSKQWGTYFENARQMKMEERPLQPPEDFLRVCFGMPIPVFSNFCPPTLAEQKTEGIASTVASSSSSIQLSSAGEAVPGARDNGPGTHRQLGVSPGPDDGEQQDAMKVEYDDVSEKMSADPVRAEAEADERAPIIMGSSMSEESTGNTNTGVKREDQQATSKVEDNAISENILVDPARAEEEADERAPIITGTSTSEGAMGDTKTKVKREDQQEKKKKGKKKERIRFRPVHDWGGRKADVTGLNSNQRRQKRAMFRAHVVRNADKYRFRLQVIVDGNAEYRCLARYFLAALDSFMATKGDSSLAAPEVQ